VARTCERRAFPIESEVPKKNRTGCPPLLTIFAHVDTSLSNLGVTMKMHQKARKHLGSFIIGFILWGLSTTNSHAQTVTLSSTSHSFGSVAVSASRTTNVRLTNLSTAAVNVISITATPGFTETNTCGTSVAASRSCTISITFAPTALGTFAGTVTIVDEGIPSTLSISLQGTGSAPFTVTPANARFGNVAIGQTSPAQTLTVTNAGTLARPLTITSSLGAGFADSTSCGASLNGGGTCTISATFTPTGAGAQTGTLSIASDIGTTTVQLTANGIAPVTVSPTTIPFSQVVEVGTPSQPRTVTITNRQSVALTINGITASPSSYAVTATTCGSSLPANTSCTITVVFTPATTGSIPGTLTISDSATGTPQVVSMTGGGTSAEFASISITVPSASLAKGAQEQLQAIGRYANGSSVNITSQVTWASANGGIASISSSGVAAGVAAGSTTITASLLEAAGTALTATASLTITSASLSSIGVTPAANSIAAGYTEQFTATGTYSDGTTQDLTASVIWASSTITVATVSISGLATTLVAGRTTISATSGSIRGTTSLTVTAPVLLSIAATPASISLGLNSTQQYTATGTYSNGTTQAITNQVTWTSGNTSVVSINRAGLAQVLGTSTVAISITATLTNSAGTVITSPPAWLSALSTLPTGCASPTIDMKLLVVNNATAGYADFPAIEQILNFVGTPYDVVDVAGAAPTLSDGACHGYYQGIIFAFGGDFYNISAWQQTLINYETTFKVRQVNWYDYPDPYFGLSSSITNTIPSTSTYTANFTAAGAPIFFYANTATPVTFSGAYIYLAPPVSTNGTVTPLLTDSFGNALSAFITLTDGRQYLTQTFDSNPYLMHNLIVAYGLLNWVTKGVFLGDYHVYATQQVDDFFIDDSEWVPSTTCLTNPLTQDRTAPDASNLPVMRVNSADLTQLVAWQTAKQADPLLTQFKLTLAMNGVGTADNPDWTGLTAPVTFTSAANGVATISAAGFSALPGEQVSVAGSTNGGGIFNGTFTVQTVTANTATTPGTTVFTVNLATHSTVAQAAETGATAAISDDLVSNLGNYQQYFHWISHTYDHPTTLNGLCQSVPSGTGCGDIYDNPPVDDIDLEIQTNLWVAGNPAGRNLDTDPSDTGLKQLTFTDFNPSNIVTPGVTGLNDPSVPSYLYNDGIRFAVSDTSVATTTNPPNNNGPNPSPNVGIVNSYAPGIYEVPRHPNDVFYNAASWADDQAEFVCIYSHYVPPNSPPGTQPAPDPPFNTYDAAQILDFTSNAFLMNMLMGDMDPEMFHQPNLHFSDNSASLTVAPVPASLAGLISPHVSSLLTDTYDLTFKKYEAVYKLPVLTPTLDQLGVLMQNRNSFNLSSTTASIVGAGTTAATISITVPSTAGTTNAVIPITGLSATGYETYGGQHISHITLGKGTTIILPLR